MGMNMHGRRSLNTGYMSAEGKRIYLLDLLKFLAALGIVLHHYCQLTGETFTHIDFYGGRFSFGTLVELFFIISGFLDAGKRIDNREKYLTHRIRRLYPMVILAVLVTAVLEYVYYKVNGAWFYDAKTTLWSLFNSLLLTSSGGAVKVFPIVNPHWYLCVLMWCYVLRCIIDWLSQKWKVAPGYLALGCIFIWEGVAQYGLDLPFFNVSASRGITAFFTGVILWKIWNKFDRKKLVLLSAVILVFSVVTYFGEYILFNDNQQDVLKYIVFPALVILAISADRFIPKWAGRPLGFLGKMSYEMYLWHFTGVLILDFLLQQGILVDLGYGSVKMIFLAVLLLVSAALYALVEVPLGKAVGKISFVRTQEQNEEE